jgi:hypothetical protein
MNKLTRRFKKKRKNKTFKGGSETKVNRPLNVEPLKNGVHAVGNVIENVNNTVGDGVGWVKDTASEAVVGTTNFFANKANEIGNSMIDAIANKVQANMPNNISEQGLDIIENSSEKFIEMEAKIARKALDETTKILKEELPNIANAAGTATAAAFETIPGIGSIAAIGTLLNKSSEAAEKSLDMVNQLQDVAAESLDTIQETIEEVKGDPLVGEASKKINNVQQSLSKASELAASKVTSKVTAASKASELAASKVTSKVTAAAAAAAAAGGFKNLTKEKVQIGGRINDSIAAFTDPIGYQSSILKGGNNKTKKSFIKNGKVKSRRVRFSF